jgi:hypothetical protein
MGGRGAQGAAFLCEPIVYHICKLFGEGKFPLHRYGYIIPAKTDSNRRPKLENPSPKVGFSNFSYVDSRPRADRTSAGPPGVIGT